MKYFFLFLFIYLPNFSNAQESFDQSFAAEKSFIQTRIKEQPEFEAFRNLPENLLNFLIFEKSHMSMPCSSRAIYDQEETPCGGCELSYQYSDDEYHPQYFCSFPIKGFWVPKKEGLSFSDLEEGEANPLERTLASGDKELLFFVHPKSESLFAPLMAKYAHQSVQGFALSLSSFRTLLVATSSEQEGSWNYYMIKVSLDEKIGVSGGVSRVVSLKEAGGSVACSHVLKQKTDLAIMPDVFSFVPSPDLLQIPEGLQHDFGGAGMMLRKIPASLLAEDSNERIVPLFSLFGKKNKPLLDLMIKNSGKTPTKFVTENILIPFATKSIDLS